MSESILALIIISIFAAISFYLIFSRPNKKGIKKEGDNYLVNGDVAMLLLEKEMSCTLQIVELKQRLKNCLHHLIEIETDSKVVQAYYNCIFLIDKVED